MNKKLSITLLIIGIIFTVLGVIAGYFVYANELHFIIAGFCFLGAIISALSKKRPIANCLIGMFIALLILLSVLTVMRWLLFVAIALIIIVSIISIVRKKKGKREI